jgi:putative transposase
VTTTWPAAIVQACIIHLIRNTFRYASRRDWDAMAKDLRPVYTAPTEPAAASRFEEFAERWAAQYPAITTLWRNA